jgi:hypothetical protein
MRFYVYNAKTSYCMGTHLARLFFAPVDVRRIRHVPRETSNTTLL